MFRLPRSEKVRKRRRRTAALFFCISSLPQEPTCPNMSLCLRTGWCHVSPCDTSSGVVSRVDQSCVWLVVVAAAAHMKTNSDFQRDTERVVGFTLATLLRSQGTSQTECCCSLTCHRKTVLWRQEEQSGHEAHSRKHKLPELSQHSAKRKTFHKNICSSDMCM